MPGLPGVAFIGNKGTLVIDRETWEVIPEVDQGQPLTAAVPVQSSKTNGLDHHTRNWLECIRSRQSPNCTIEMGRDAAVIAQLGNIAYRSGTKVYWDEKKATVIHNPEARQLTKARYRSPWKLPAV